MKRFTFSLEQVRHWRHEQADVEEQKLQRLHAELQAIETHCKQIEKERLAARQGAMERSPPDIQELVQLDHFLEFTRGQLNQVKQKRTQCEANIEQQRQKLIEARRQFELLDRLKQKALTEWRAEADKEQEDLAAELYLAKRRRNPNDRVLND